jgi:phosphotransferase system enzyme I (PtsP)
MLRALRGVAAKARAAGKPVTVCGEMAGRPLETLALIGLGFRAFSMSPAAVGPVKAMLMTLDAAAAEKALEGMLADCDGCPTLRDQLATFAEKHGVQV